MSIKQSNSDKNKTSEIDDHIRRNFDIKKRLGKGAYGIVWKAVDRKTQQVVAIKKIFDAFRNETDAQRTFREIMFLRAFRNHANIVQLYSIHRATNHMDIYLSFEYMESDLHNVIKRGSILKDIHKRYVMYQLFNATNYIHSGNVIHRDMKPSNVLVDSKCRCKLADFGLARSVSPHQANDGSPVGTLEACLTDYVATRWYRAPEILIANKNYTKGIDMWSLGCILGEMIRGRPLFPGSCTVNQVECIVSALPEATEQDIKAVGNGFGSALLNQPSKEQANKNPTPKLDELLIDSPSDAKHLIKSLLALDPGKRLTARQALDHKYIEKFRNTSPEIELNSDVIPPFRDDVQLTVSEYRSKLYEIMALTEKAAEKNIMIRKSSFSDIPQKRDSTISTTASINNHNSNNINRKTLYSQSQPSERKLLVKQISETSSTVAKLQHTVANLKKVATQQMLGSNTSISSIQQRHPSHHHQQQQQQTSFISTNHHGNGNHSSYARLTNKLNCCKGCNAVQENGDKNNNNIKHHMGKMKSDKPQLNGAIQNPSATMHFSTSNRLIHRESIDDASHTQKTNGNHINYNNGRLATLDRRNSMESSLLHQTVNGLKRNGHENITFNSVPDFRRQSFDGGTMILPQTTPPIMYTQNIAGDVKKMHSNGGGGGGGGGGGRMSTLIGDKTFQHRYGNNSSTTTKPSAALNNGTLKKQYSTGDDYLDVNSRLKTYDENKMRQRKMNVLEYVTERQQIKSKNLLNEYASRKAGKHTDFIGLADGQINSSLNNSLASLSEYGKNRIKAKNSNKVELTYPDYGKTVAARNKNTISSNANYGVISATDLFKLRSMS